jgi:hypothetical protein
MVPSFKPPCFTYYVHAALLSGKRSFGRLQAVGTSHSSPDGCGSLASSRLPISSELPGVFLTDCSDDGRAAAPGISMGGGGPPPSWACSTTCSTRALRVTFELYAPDVYWTALSSSRTIRWSEVRGLRSAGQHSLTRYHVVELHRKPPPRKFFQV